MRVSLLCASGGLAKPSSAESRYDKPYKKKQPGLSIKAWLTGRRWVVVEAAMVKEGVLWDEFVKMVGWQRRKGFSTNGG